MLHKAVNIAAFAHAWQVRKTNDYPYLIHPLEVGQLLKQYDCSEVLIAAGITHDCVEDTKTGVEEMKQLIKDELSQEVLDLVLSVTENKLFEWKTRKQIYIDNIKTMTADQVKLMCADKINNLDSLLHTLRKHGPEYTWARFNKPKDEQKWFFESILKEVKELLPKYKDDEVILSMYIQLGSYYTAVFLKM